MERKLLEMVDPVFLPGVTETARAPITVSPSGLSCEVELFLGPNDSTKVVSKRVAFTSTGNQQIVPIPITMPTAVGGSYHVYLDVYVEGYLLVGYAATEDVIIPSGSIGPIVWD